MVVTVTGATVVSGQPSNWQNRLSVRSTFLSNNSIAANLVHHPHSQHSIMGKKKKGSGKQKKKNNNNNNSSTTNNTNNNTNTATTAIDARRARLAKLGGVPRSGVGLWPISKTLTLIKPLERPSCTCMQMLHEGNGHYDPNSCQLHEKILTCLPIDRSSSMKLMTNQTIQRAYE